MRGDAVAPARADGAGRGDPADRPSPLADLRPVGPGAVLDGAVDLLRHRFGRIVALAACLFVPVWLLNVVLALAAPPPLSGGSGLDWSGMSTATSSPLVYLVMALQLVALSVLGLCVGHLAIELACGRDASLSELGSVALRRGWVALLIVPLNALVHGPALCFAGVGWIIGDALVFLSSVVAGAERRGPWSSFVRGMSLTRAEFGRALAISLGGLCLTQLIRLSLSFGPTVLITSLAPGSSLATMFGALSTGVLLLTQPLSACIAARAYLDLRCRRDGLDLVLRRERSSLQRPGVAS